MDTKCLHAKRYYKGESDVDFCRECGILILNKNVFSMKPGRYNYTVEFNPLKIYDNLKKSSKHESMINEEIFKNQIFFQKRTEMIKLLNKLIHKLRFRSQTFYLAIYFYDLIMFYTDDIRAEIVATCCLLLAAKFDENDTTVPNLPYFKNLMENYYISFEELRKFEVCCLNILNYRLDYITAYHFINFFLAQGIVFNNETIYENLDYQSNNIQSSTSSSNSSELNRKLKSKEIIRISELVKECLLLFIENPKFNSFSPLQVACGCIAVAREAMKLKEQWSRMLSEVYKIEFYEFEECYNLIKTIHLKRKCALKEQEINNFLSNKKQKNKEKEKEKIYFTGEKEIKVDIPRVVFSDENMIKNIKSSIDQQIREKEMQLNTERGTKRAFHDNITDRYFSNEDQNKTNSNKVINDFFDKIVTKKNEIVHSTSMFNGGEYKSSNIINKTKELLSSNKFSVPKKQSLGSNPIKKTDYSATEETRKTYKNIKLSGNNFNSCNYNYLKDQILNNYSTNINYTNGYNEKSFIKTFNYLHQDVYTKNASNTYKGFSEKFSSNDFEGISKNFSRLNNLKDNF